MHKVDLLQSTRYYKALSQCLYWVYDHTLHVNFMLEKLQRCFDALKQISNAMCSVVSQVYSEKKVQVSCILFSFV